MNLGKIIPSTYARHFWTQIVNALTTIRLVNSVKAAAVEHTICPAHGFNPHRSKQVPRSANVLHQALSILEDESSRFNLGANLNQIRGCGTFAYYETKHNAESTTVRFFCRYRISHVKPSLAPKNLYPASAKKGVDALHLCKVPAGARPCPVCYPNTIAKNEYLKLCKVVTGEKPCPVCYPNFDNLRRDLLVHQREATGSSKKEDTTELRTKVKVLEAPSTLYKNTPKNLMRRYSGLQTVNARVPCTIQWKDSTICKTENHHGLSNVCKIVVGERPCPICYPNLETLRIKTSLFSQWQTKNIDKMEATQSARSKPQPVLTSAEDNLNQTEEVKQPCHEDCITIIDLCNMFQAKQTKPKSTKPEQPPQIPNKKEPTVEVGLGKANVQEMFPATMVNDAYVFASSAACLWNEERGRGFDKRRRRSLCHPHQRTPLYAVWF